MLHVTTKTLSCHRLDDHSGEGEELSVINRSNVFAVPLLVLVLVVVCNLLMLRFFMCFIDCPALSTSSI